MKIKILLLTLAVISICSSSVSGQQLDHVQGEILIQHQIYVNAQEWIKRTAHSNNTIAHLKYEKIVSAPLNIHRYTFDHSAINEIRLLEAVKNNEQVHVAQFNHFLDLRETIPNDPQFTDQWQYINMGQSGGTVGADIDAELAWDITTGALTPEGDTIVVCIIDGGYEITHPDLADNVWYNYAEIPGNGIDDDNNGFVDDFKGWSTSSQSDAIDSAPTGHGTPVAGIVGAKGNNGIGVAGVNWDVKLMLVAGGTGVESEVLEAYSYALVARIRYNETNGAEGAFVVSTNASWGIDFGQPADAPLWCSFYDSLGVHGIVSCGATINDNQNVDQIGDLPTACPSDYLISVTNMNRNDEKVTGAGYGLETIDLGAFGADTWTLENGSGYGPFGGTSGATPHVAGAIALLYAAPCNNLTALAKANPAAAALQARDYILDNGDDNPSLEGITVTGKRLNLNNSLVFLMGECGPCPPPHSIRANDVTDTSTSLDWSSNDNTIADTLHWREQGMTTWTVVAPAIAPYQLTGLQACTFYEVQITSSCDTISSDPSAIFTFKTDGCCELPSVLTASNISNNDAMMTWESVLAAQSYDIRYREVAATDWTEVTGLTTTEYMIPNLMECTAYEVEIQLNCANQTIPYGTNISFTTTGCGICFDLDYCEIEGLDASLEWIESFEVGAINNISGGNNGYANFSADFSTIFQQYGTYEFTLTPGYDSQAYDELVIIWIDLNADGIFDTNEIVYETSGINSPLTDEFQIPGTATTGNTRMRVAMVFENVNNSCDMGDNNFGELEDYCIEIVEGQPQCVETSNIQITSITETTASVGWQAVNFGDSYLVRYKASTAGTWNEMTTASNSIELTGLEECLNHEVQINSVCSFGESGFTDSEEFMTQCVNSIADPTGDLSSYQAFPSPFGEYLNLNFTTRSSLDYITINLLNELGQVVYDKTLENVSAQPQEIQINTNDLPDGLYLIRIQTAEDQNIIKVIKTK